MLSFKLPSLHKNAEKIQKTYQEQLAFFKATHPLTNEEKRKYPFFTFVHLFDERNKQLALEFRALKALSNAMKPQLGTASASRCWEKNKKCFDTFTMLQELFPNSQLLQDDVLAFLKAYAQKRNRRP